MKHSLCNIEAYKEKLCPVFGHYTPLSKILLLGLEVGYNSILDIGYINKL
jgi:hypothetical protein